VKKGHVGAKCEVWCIINRIKLPSDAFATDNFKAAPVYVPKMDVLFIVTCPIAITFVESLLFFFIL
jgi:hypothetical protein